MAADQALNRIVADPARPEAEVVASLLEAGEASVPVLRAGLTDSRLWVRGRVAAALAWVDEPVFQQVQAGLDEAAVYALCSSYMLQQPEFACAAARALARLRDRRAVSALCTWAEHEDADVRRAAAEALGAIGHPGALDPLCRLVAAGAAPARPRRVHEGHPPTPAAVRAEIAAVAAKALGQLGDPRAVRHLARALDSGDRGVRLAAAGALARIGGPTAAREIASRLWQLLLYSNHSTDDRAELLNALAAMGKPAVRPLCDLLLQNDPHFLCATLEAIARIGDPNAVRAVRRCLHKWEPEVRRAAARTLTALNWQPGSLNDSVFYCLASGDEDRLEELGATAVKPLGWWLSKGQDWIRQGAAEALGRLERREALPLLEKRLGPLGEIHEEVRTAIHAAIRRITAATGERAGLPRAELTTPLPEGRPREDAEAPAVHLRPRTG